MASVRRAFFLGAPLAVLAASTALHAQPAPSGAPAAYTLTETTAMMGQPMTVKLARDGSKEFMDESGGGEHVVQLFDFAAQKLYTTDPKTNKCTVESYTDPEAPPPLDPISGAHELTTDLMRGNPRPVGNDTVNGMPATVYEFSHPDGEKLRLWLANQGRYPVRAVMSDGKGHSETQLDVTSLSFNRPEASMLATPAGPCTPIQAQQQGGPPAGQGMPPQQRPPRPRQQQ